MKSKQLNQFLECALHRRSNASLWTPATVWNHSGWFGATRSFLLCGELQRSSDWAFPSRLRPGWKNITGHITEYLKIEISCDRQYRIHSSQWTRVLCVKAMVRWNDSPDGQKSVWKGGDDPVKKGRTDHYRVSYHNHPGLANGRRRQGDKEYHALSKNHR